MDKGMEESILRPTCDARDQSLALGGAGGVDQGSLFAQCLSFVREQSAGEWGDEAEHQDAKKLAQFVAQKQHERALSVAGSGRGRAQGLRDEFAMAAIAGRLPTHPSDQQREARVAYEIADAMMKARSLFFEGEAND